MKVIGKMLDASEIKDILVQGEAKADTVKIELPKTYGKLNLSQLAFTILAKLRTGVVVSQELEKTIGNKIILTWNITKEFTAADGVVYLELWGKDEETLIKFVGNPIYIKKTEAKI